VCFQHLIQKYIGDEEIYKKLREKLTDEEIADSMLIPQDLSDAERQKTNKELLAFRFKLLRNQTEEKRIYFDQLRSKYLMEDNLKKRRF